VTAAHPKAAKVTHDLEVYLPPQPKADPVLTLDSAHLQFAAEHFVHYPAVQDFAIPGMASFHHPTHHFYHLCSPRDPRVPVLLFFFALLWRFVPHGKHVHT
jgi:hypothetical protein